MIASHPRVRFFSEPLNPDHQDCPVHHYFHYVTAADEARFIAYLRPAFELKYAGPAKANGRRSIRTYFAETLRAIKCFISRQLGYRPLVKDPMAFFSAEWLTRRYETDTIVLSRHPAAFASSLKRLNWFFPFDHLLEQPVLMEDSLRPFHDEIERFARRPPDIISQAILLWRILHTTILRYKLKHPEWIFVRHEDLSARPVEEFRKLFAAVELDFTDRSRRTIELHSHRENPVEAAAGVVHQLKRDSLNNIWNWTRRLRPEEILRIRRGTAAISHHFYADADWQAPGARRAFAAC
jgi:hypothetical protein